jgi:RimJ/RimL family protein N-acetyltransferase
MTLAPGADRIESERLVLRRMTRDDYDFFARIHAMPEVRRYLGDGRLHSAEESRAWIENMVATYESSTLGPLAVVRKLDGQLIGRCGLSELVVEANAAPGTIPRGWFQRAQAPAGIELVLTPDLGYTFDPASWGHGYATEAARCVFEYARTNLRWPRMCRSYIRRTRHRCALPRDVACGVADRSNSCRAYVSSMCGRPGPRGRMAESVSLEGHVELEDGQLILRIPLEAGGDKLAPLAQGIGEVRGGDLVVVIPAWLAEKLDIGANSLVVVDNQAGKCRITRSDANDR